VAIGVEARAATPTRRLSSAQLECSVCGAGAVASCNCGAPYVSAGVRAAEAIAKNPEKSDRAIADDLGVGSNTVRRARKSRRQQRVRS
jgi:predicted amidophosphoribosyltransferase